MKEHYTANEISNIAKRFELPNKKFSCLRPPPGVVNQLFPGRVEVEVTGEEKLAEELEKALSLYFDAVALKALPKPKQAQKSLERIEKAAKQLLIALNVGENIGKFDKPFWELFLRKPFENFARNDWPVSLQKKPNEHDLDSDVQVSREGEKAFRSTVYGILEIEFAANRFSNPKIHDEEFPKEPIIPSRFFVFALCGIWRSVFGREPTITTDTIGPTTNKPSGKFIDFVQACTTPIEGMQTPSIYQIEDWTDRFRGLGKYRE